ncbi:hypothetical protein ACFOY4_42935 [Actinomadura syzygii]|uniref:Uncharacterized protein n=1 Tax=Actinomadura syzygii TaxID=1427538 RepID=A0A5D0TPT8_9ACTN|nr:hypothetical protein [Actinomadura syzygii]TYC07827.1 hypothetical protein FXF65_40505 [Actinomadura syzygii]
MTPKETPDGEHGGDLPEADAPAPHLPGPPPRPQWLDDEDEPAAADPAPVEEPADEPAEDDGRTQVVRQAARPPQPPRPSGGMADFTMTDFSRGTGTPSGEQAEDEEEGADRTRAERPAARQAQPEQQLPPLPPFPWAQETPPAASPQPPAPQPPAPQPPVPRPPAPEPFPYAQEIPETPKPPAAEPFPYAQEIPETPKPTAAEPFPWAQEIPDTPRAPAPEPFPWAQEIPGQTSGPAASQPFPYAQEVPGQTSDPRASQPFPYAQEVPGPGPTASPSPVAPHPVAPPPQVDEPWRQQPQPKRKGGGVAKKVLLGVAGVVVVGGLVAGGFVILNSRGGDSDGGGEDGARLAGKLFAADPAARVDGRDQELTGVAASGATVVAVGGEADPGNYRGVFVVSTDGGRTFKTAEVQGADGGEPGPGEVPRVVAGGQGGWVAIGNRPGGGAVWTSPDGRAWRRQPDAAGDVFGPGNRLTQVIGTDKGFLALGENSRKGDFSDATPAVWLSADGRNWDALTGSRIGVPLRGRVVLEEAAASGGTVLMESAHTPSPGKASFRRAWRSTDGGRTWSPAKIPAPKGTRGLRVGGGRAGLVAVREVQSGKSVFGQVYTSPDAARWKAAGKLAPSGYRQVRQLLSTDAGYAAIVERARDIAVSRSADGASWQDAGTLSASSGRSLLGASATAEQTVLVGRDPGEGDLNPLLAVRDARGAELPVDPLKIPGAFRPDQAVAAVAAADGAPAVAVGSTGGDAAIWSSADGASWTRARFSGGVSRPALQRLTSVAHGAAGWLAVGDGGGAPRGPLVMTSSDGALWRPADTDPVFERKGSLPLATQGAAAAQAGYVVVGDDGPSGAIWFSPDLKSWQRGRGVGRNDLTADKGGGRWVRDAAGGAFGFAAVGGMQWPGRPGGRPAVWSSPDGRKWRLQELKLPAGLSQGWLTHVAAKGNALFAAGEAVGSSGTAMLGYVSADGGRTWRPATLPASGSNDPVRVTAVTATPSGFVVAGTAGPAGAADVVAWTSADGASWKAQAPGDDVLGATGRQEITGLTPFKGALLGVGRTVAGSGEQPVLWKRPAP